MKRKSENHPDMSLTNLTTALCGEPLFCDLPIGTVYEIAEQAQAAAVAALRSGRFQGLQGVDGAFGTVGSTGN